MRKRTSASHACGSTPFILAVTMRLYMAAARRPPRSDPQNNQDFRPSATPRSPRSAALVEMHTRPSSRNRVKACQRLSMYWTALTRSCPRDSLAACSRMEVTRSSTSVRLSARRTARRSSGLWPLISRSIANSASMRRITSMAIGESGISLFPPALRRTFSSMSARTKNLRRACAQHAASRIGPGLRSAR